MLCVRKLSKAFIRAICIVGKDVGPHLQGFQPTARLNNGECIPLFGLGTFKADAKTTHEAVAAALKCGILHVDCASHYGNEWAIGNGLRAAFKQGGIARREDVFITSKLWSVPKPSFLPHAMPMLEGTVKPRRMLCATECASGCPTVAFLHAATPR